MPNDEAKTTDDLESIKEFLEDVKEEDETLDALDDDAEEQSVLNAKVKLDDIDIHDVAEEAQLMRDAIGAPEPPEPTDLDSNSTFEEDKKTSLQKTKEAASSLFSKRFENLEVTVTRDDKDRFFTSSMNDADLTFVIDIGGLDTVVDVTIASTRLQTAIIDAMGELVKAGAVTADEKWLHYFQCLSMHVQVRRVAGRLATTFDWEKERTYRELVDYLADEELISEINNMSVPRWQLLARSQLIADKKLQICNENILNRSFFENADTD